MGNPLTNIISTVTLPFRAQVRRAASLVVPKHQDGHPNGISNGNGYTYVNGTNGSTNGHLNGHINGHTNGYTTMDSERRPLLGNGHSTTESDSDFSWRDFFLDTKRTPGTNDPNPLVKYPTRVWNVTKVTLLSCMYPTANSRPTKHMANMSQHGSTSFSSSCPSASSPASEAGVHRQCSPSTSLPSSPSPRSSLLRPKRSPTD